MDNSNIFVTFATNQYSYLIPFAILVAMYCAWTLARRQYLNVNKLFNLVTISLVVGWGLSFIFQHAFTSSLLHQPTVNSLWIHPRPVIVLIGYIGIALATGRYIRAIRYPYWRTIDMVAAALSLFLLILLIGWIVQYLMWTTAMVFMAAMVGVILIIWCAVKLERQGIATALHLVTVFVITGLARLAIPAWQDSTTIVEWIAVGIGIIIGLGVLSIRVSSRSEQAILQDIPRGVSQGFYETFSRAFKHKQLPKDEG